MAELATCSGAPALVEAAGMLEWRSSCFLSSSAFLGDEGEENED